MSNGTSPTAKRIREAESSKTDETILVVYAAPDMINSIKDAIKKKGGSAKTESESESDSESSSDDSDDSSDDASVHSSESESSEDESSQDSVESD